MPHSQPKLSPTAVIQVIFLSAACLVSGFNAATLYKEMNQLAQIRRYIPYIFVGNKFLGLSAVLKDAHVVGYYTDKNLDENKPASQFAQAQYILAPIILDLNDTDHPFVLFDCTSEEVAFQKIKEAGLVPVKKNQFGIILAAKPPQTQATRPNLRIHLFPKPE